MQGVTISEVTPRGMPVPPAAPETELRSPVVHADAPTPPREAPELLRRSTVAEKLLFAPTIDGRLKITKPFEVTVERSGGTVTAHVEEIDEFGYGSDSGEALYDLGKTLSELYFSLKEDADRLSPDLHSVWLKLNEHIQPRQE
jgi:hypothetical protein